MTRCVVCGKPGLLIPPPTDIPRLGEPSPTRGLWLPEPEAACAAHRRIVELRLRERFAPVRSAYIEGRPRP